MKKQAKMEAEPPRGDEGSQDFAVLAHGLVKVFGDNRAVDGLDLSIPTGSIYALLGPNGAGNEWITKGDEIVGSI
jgi:ABC-type lipopolysaccharide export system ATPase subunit